MATGPQPIQAFLSLQGDAAINAAPQVQQQIQQAQTDVLSGLPGRAQQIYGSVAAGRASDALAQVNSHVSTQRTNANIASSQARIDAATNDAAASWNNPNTLAKSLGIAQAEATAMAGAHGFDANSDVTAELARKAQADIYGQVFKNAIASDPSGNTAAHMFSSMASKFLAMLRLQFNMRSTPRRSRIRRSSVAFSLRRSRTTLLRLRPQAKTLRRSAMAKFRPRTVTKPRAFSSVSAWQSILTRPCNKRRSVRPRKMLRRWRASRHRAKGLPRKNMHKARCKR